MRQRSATRPCGSERLLETRSKCIMSMVMKTRLVLALLAIQDFSMCSQVAAKEEWPDGPNKSWFQTLQRPDNDKNPSRDEKSRFCCGIADTVKTKFRVEAGDARHPDDRWYAWLDNGWVLIPPEKIVADHAPDGQAYLFMLANTIQCFVRPKGGI